MSTKRIALIVLGVLFAALVYVHLAVGIVDWLPFAGS